MVYHYVYAKDFSGSTESYDYYHINGLKTLQEFKNDVDKISKDLTKSGDETKSKVTYLHWGHECVEVDPKTALDAYQKRRGTGRDTRPERIIQWLKDNIDLKNDKIKLIYIITDGLIADSSLQSCLALNEEMAYEIVVFHAFNEMLDCIDLSVASSFLKGRCSIYSNYELTDDADVGEEYEYEKINLENFDQEKNKLKSYIKLKYINKKGNNAGALKEIEKLKELRQRLFKELSSVQRSTLNLETKDKNEFIRTFKLTHWYRSLFSSQDLKVDVEKSISTLINYIVNDKKSYAFDALKFQTNFKAEVEEEPIADVDLPDAQKIEFPDIILDDEKGIPVVILTEFSLLDKIIFHKTDNDTDAVSPASFSKFKSVMECPLFLANDTDISESIGYFYTLNVFKQLLEKTTKTEPRTRKPFHGGLVLVDTDEFDKYNDYVLAATYFNFKKVNYNIGLFYYVLWKNCEKKEWMDKNVVEQFKKYVLRRISSTICNIGLSSLPLDPNIKTSLPTALWYCVELSSDIFKNDPQNFSHERLRMYYGIAYYMIEILKFFNYNLDLDAFEKRRDLLSHVMTLKKIQPHKEKVYYLLKNIFRSKNGFLVSEIQNHNNLRKLNYLTLDHKEQLSDDVIDQKVKINDFVHLIYYEDRENREKIKIFDKTYRPFFTLDQDRSFYTELLKTTKEIEIINDSNNEIKIKLKPLESLHFDKLLSVYKLFIDCVADLDRYPTMSEYIEYVLRKKKFKDDLVTIFPTNIHEALEEVFDNYKNIINSVDAKEFTSVCKKYVNRTDRIKAEEVRTFKSDSEIDEFVKKQEKLVKLRAN